ncbi:MBL fold metallo-hydrolase [uncultured Sphingomonas sp.]|uniref:MBL fold metallo-hydrolase n=1 Tax=uncultured Sphingomonas sp. TaxID=158754 RepID=UPI0035CA06EC
MTRRWLLVAGVGLLTLAAAVAAILAVPAVDDTIFRYFVERRLVAGDTALLGGQDALKVLLCGTSAPFADPARAQSCTAIIAGGRYYLVDTGPGSARNLMLWRLQGRELGAVFLTHFHSDHIGDLGEVNTNAWLAGHAGPLPVFGGPGVAAVVDGFNRAYALDQSYRVANAGAKLQPPAAAVMQSIVIPLAGPPTASLSRTSRPLRFGDLTVTAIEVNHDPAAPAYGYRFDYRGRSVTISGDTRYHPPLGKAARRSDVLVHEAQSQHLVDLVSEAAHDVGRDRIAQTMRDIHHYHTDPVDAARIANAAGVRLVVFTHLDPPPSNWLISRMFYRGVDEVRPKGWISGEDGTLITCPVGSSAITISTLQR